jgi:hypothetical protein
LPFSIQVHVAARRLGRGFAVVEEVGFALHEQGHEAASADVACFGVGHGQRKGGGDGGINGVAALFQDLRRHLRAILVGRCNGAAFKRNGING